MASTWSPTRRPRGLDPARTYRLTCDAGGTTRTVDGGRLMDDGVRVGVAAPFTSDLLTFEAV